MPQRSYVSADDVRAMPWDGPRYETVHGELLVTPSPGGPHQFTSGRLHVLRGNFLAFLGVEQLLASPADISFGPDTLVQPDLFIADLDQFACTGVWADIRTFYLVIEIISPSSVRADRFTKRRLYQEQRVPEYWVVDIAGRQVEVWTPDALFPRVEHERAIWRHPVLGVECVVDLTTLFR